MMCGYQIGTIECRGDGYCWDADHDGYDPNDHSLPCPRCNTKEFLEGAKEDAETTSHYSSMSDSGTGNTIWQSAVLIAKEQNPEQAEVALISIGCVKALESEEYIHSSTTVVEYTYNCHGTEAIRTYPDEEDEEASPVDWDDNCGFIGAVADESKTFKNRVESVVKDLKNKDYARWDTMLDVDGVQIQIVITRDETDFMPTED